MRRDPAIRRSFAVDLATALVVSAALNAVGALTGYADDLPLNAVTWLAQVAVAVIAIRWALYEVRPAWSDKVQG